MNHPNRPSLVNPALLWPGKVDAVELRACFTCDGIIDDYLNRAQSEDPMDRVVGIRGLEAAAKDNSLMAYEALRYLKLGGECSGLEADFIDIAIESVESMNIIPVPAEKLWDGLHVGQSMAICASYPGLARLTAALTAMESPEVVAQVHGLSGLERLAKEGSVIAKAAIGQVASERNRDEDVKWLATRCLMAMRGETPDPAIPLPSAQRTAMRHMAVNVRNGRRDLLPTMIKYALDKRPLFAAANEEARRAIHENGWL